MWVIVDGWESLGKGYLLKDLTRELDPKFFEVAVFDAPQGLEDQYPDYFDHFQDLLAKTHFDKSPWPRISGGRSHT